MTLSLPWFVDVVEVKETGGGTEVGIEDSWDVQDGYGYAEKHENNKSIKLSSRQSWLSNNSYRKDHYISNSNRNGFMTRKETKFGDFLYEV